MFKELIFNLLGAKGLRRKKVSPVETLHLVNSLKSSLRIIFNVVPQPLFWSLYTTIKGNMKPTSQRHQGLLNHPDHMPELETRVGHSHTGSCSDRQFPLIFIPSNTCPRFFSYLASAFLCFCFVCSSEDLYAGFCSI